MLSPIMLHCEVNMLSQTDTNRQSLWTAPCWFARPVPNNRSHCSCLFMTAARAQCWSPMRQTPLGFTVNGYIYIYIHMYDYIFILIYWYIMFPLYSRPWGRFFVTIEPYYEAMGSHNPSKTTRAQVSNRKVHPQTRRPLAEELLWESTDRKQLPSNTQGILYIIPPLVDLRHWHHLYLHCVWPVSWFVSFLPFFLDQTNLQNHTIST